MGKAQDRVRVDGGRALAQWVVVVALALVAGALAGQMFFAPPAAAQTGSAGRPDGVFAIAGQVTRDSYGLYLVDVRNGTICMYQYLTGERCLRLMAARTFIYDRQLDSYNTKPLPKDVAKIVAEAKRLKDTTTKP